MAAKQKLQKMSLNFIFKLQIGRQLCLMLADKESILRSRCKMCNDTKTKPKDFSFALKSKTRAVVDELGPHWE